jgi:hypothetical protein
MLVIRKLTNAPHDSTCYVSNRRIHIACEPTRVWPQRDMDVSASSHPSLASSAELWPLSCQRFMPTKSLRRRNAHKILHQHSHSAGVKLIPPAHSSNSLLLSISATVLLSFEAFLARRAAIRSRMGCEVWFLYDIFVAPRRAF